ncbi:MAG TPA: cyclic nucleotide-binding domain-containing protein [Terriglobales bacterium]|nr:cyclic nucleotide-binding domain-containing protein [Terriglobales bacterium]
MSHRAASSSSVVELTIDGQTIKVPAGTTVFDAARMNGIEIPVLCHQQNETPVGVCRMCVVDVGARTYAAACIRHVDPGMAVKTQTKEVLAARKTLLELMMADHPTPCVRQQHTGDCELERLATEYGASASRYPRREVTRGQDDSSLTILVDHSACILCDRCVRACADLRHNFVIARQGKGYDAGISFDLDDPMGSSTCVSCGECMVSCPTGALTNKVAAGQKLESGLSLETEELLKLPVFQGVSGTFLEVNRGSVTMRKIKKGELLFREGDYGSTAFYILEGQIDIFISSPRAHVNTQKGTSRLFNILQNKLVGRREQPRPDENFARTYISIDAPVELSYDHPVAQLGPGDLFGEMTCMSFYPRSATARAATDCVVLEMLRNVLDVLQKNKTFRARLENDYRQRALETHLRSVPILSVLTHEFIDELRDKVELVRYAPGEVIFHQGDLADAFYLVRIGFVKVSEQYPGGELVLAYLSKGNYFGEIGLLGGGKRTATCSALDHVEVVRISTADFTEMLRQFPEVRGRLETISAERLRENQARFKQVSQVPVDEFLRQGLMEARNLLVLDLDRCTRCDQCVKACADAHGGVTRLIRDGLRLDRFLIATSCRHCRDPLCMVGCPVGAIRRQNSLEVIIEDWCIGCGVCANNCPYGNINLQNFSVDGPVSDEIAQLAAGQERAKKARVVRKATSCNLCNDYPEPSCVYACPHDAAHRVEPVEFFGRMIKE